MPLSEFHRAATRGKLESSQYKMINSTSDVSSFMPDQEFVELLWENGQVVMQGQSSRPKKNLNYSSVQEKNGRDAPMEKFGQFEAIEPARNELSPAVPCANIGLNADVDPWITNYPIEDPLCSEFFPEFAGINPYSPSTERNNSSAAKGFHYVEHNHSSKLSREDLEPSRFKAAKLFRSSQRCQSSPTNTKSRLTEFGFGGGSSSTQQSQFQKQDLVSSSKPHQGSNTFRLMNFSHFSRPVSLAKANIKSVDRLRSHQKGQSTTDPTESATLVESRSATKTIHELVPVEPPLQAICKNDLYRNNHQKNTAVANSNSKLPDDQINHQSSSFGASAAAQRQEAEKAPEAVVASSVCSGNSAGAASNDPKIGGKRKLRGGEESGSYSEDIDDELIVVKKPTGGSIGTGTGTKRSRAAEVHNLSERRRRDRINERMRALQELIPNCNKVDKASVLDEAIEYLKTLQLQVQMMSMGSVLYMPPMMLPPGIQHVRASPMAHFSPMGLGMSMGLGYGMPMLDINGSQGCPLVPVPMHTSQLSCPSIPGTAGLHGISGSTGLQLFGIPSHGQGLPISMPRPPLSSPLSGLTSMTNSMNGVATATANPLPVSHIGPSSRCKDQQQQQQCTNSNE